MDSLRAPGIMGTPRSGRLFLHTLTPIRWIGVMAQVTILLVAHLLLTLPGPIVPIIILIGVSAGLNLAFDFLRQPRPLDDREAALVLGFDILQISAVVYLSGGLYNPFAALILAPLTIASAVLSRGSVAALAAMTVTALALLLDYHWPVTPNKLLALPSERWMIGLWIALSSTAIFIALFNWWLASRSRALAEALATTQQRLAEERETAALGTLAAAAAHELGSPLSTISVVAREMAKEVLEDDPLHADVQLLLTQSQRCQEILARFVKRPDPGASPFKNAPISVLVTEAAEACRKEGKQLDLVRKEGDGVKEPIVDRRPELREALKNLIQNALQFAKTRVVVEIAWPVQGVIIRISDDGPGFDPALLAKLGEPYVSSRSGNDGHMGLGVFIAQTLFQRLGATLRFANPRRGGAEVTVTWPVVALYGLHEDEEEAAP